MIERAYREAEAAGIVLCNQDEAGPYQTVPYPGEHWVQESEARSTDFTLWMLQQLPYQDAAIARALRPLTASTDPGYQLPDSATDPNVTYGSCIVRQWARRRSK
jgi:hypothetical protein